VVVRLKKNLIWPQKETACVLCMGARVLCGSGWRAHGKLL
jgi:hypothetical protein